MENALIIAQYPHVKKEAWIKKDNNAQYIRCDNIEPHANPTTFGDQLITPTTSKQLIFRV